MSPGRHVVISSPAWIERPARSPASGRTRGRRREPDQQLGRRGVRRRAPARTAGRGCPRPSMQPVGRGGAREQIGQERRAVRSDLHDRGAEPGPQRGGGVGARPTRSASASRAPPRPRRRSSRADRRPQASHGGPCGASTPTSSSTAVQAASSNAAPGAGSGSGIRTSSTTKPEARRVQPDAQAAGRRPPHGHADAVGLEAHRADVEHRPLRVEPAAAHPERDRRGRSSRSRARRPGRWWPARARACPRRPCSGRRSCRRASCPQRRGAARSRRRRPGARTRSRDRPRGTCHGIVGGAGARDGACRGAEHVAARRRAVPRTRRRGR